MQKQKTAVEKLVSLPVRICIKGGYLVSFAVCKEGQTISSKNYNPFTIRFQYWIQAGLYAIVLQPQHIYYAPGQFISCLYAKALLLTEMFLSCFFAYRSLKNTEVQLSLRRKANDSPSAPAKRARFLPAAIHGCDTTNADPPASGAWRTQHYFRSHSV